MHDLRWTMPVARWSATAAAVAADISFIEPIVRRRLSSLSRIALKVAHDCVAERDRVRVVFASRHGELRRTTDILRAISAGERRFYLSKALEFSTRARVPVPTMSESA